MSNTINYSHPALTCNLCPRLHEFRTKNQELYPEFYNAPVPVFAPPQDFPSSSLMVIGLAPGLKGANQTGRPFTGDYAGDLLYDTLIKFGFAQGQYKKSPDDGLILNNCVITNAVKCVPPQNKPIGFEINQCRPFLISELNYFRPKIILTLGRISHETTLKTLQLKSRQHPFSHGGQHQTMWRDNNITIVNSYHCSRYNTQTNRLTVPMFEQIFQQIIDLIKE